MKKFVILVVFGLLFAACEKSEQRAKTAEDPQAIAVTHWTEQSELFLEYPPVVAGTNARFSVHLTDLHSFKPLAEGRVTVELRSASGRVETFGTAAPSRPGIFGVDVKLEFSGAYALTVRLESPAFMDAHEIGSLQVYADDEAAAQAARPGEVEAIRFLKEQQWTLDFATAVVAERTLRESLRVPAQVRPRTGGEAEVTTPVAGKLITSGVLPGVGTPVREGQILAGIIPRTGTPLDRAALEFAVHEARVALQLAQRDRQRTERLSNAGAIPGKRLDEARAAEATEQARLDAAQTRLAQHELTRTSQGSAAENAQFFLRAPITGIVASSRGTPGASVEEGQSLFRIVALDPVYVVASVPEAESWRLRQLSGGEFEVAGEANPVPLVRIVSISRVVDLESRTLPVIFEVRNPDARLAVGQSVFARLFTAGASSGPTVPESALVDDAGRPVVFVQVAGESFLRRPVRLGVRESGYVRILEGIKPGDRIVTAGAYQIRLAALSPQVPAHGHVH